jgi:SAM-dependent methyltransferase
VLADEDAFGTALRDYVLGREAPTPLTMEFDNGVEAPALPPEWFFQSPAQWDAPERSVLSAVTSGPVLDLGAGAGRHSLFMQDIGFEVTAIDASPGAVEVCRLRGVRDVRLADLTEPPTDKQWTAVLLMCGNLGLAGGWDDTRGLLRRLAEICAEDAIIVADSVDPTDPPGEPRATDSPSAVDRNVGVAVFRLRYGSLVSPWTRLLNVPIVDVEALIEGTGWRLDQHERAGIDHYAVLRRLG